MNIFISSFHPLISRNILLTGVLGGLKSSGFFIYILCPEYKKEYFIKEFEDEKVKIIGIDNEPLNIREAFFKKLGFSLLSTSTVAFKKKEKFIRDKNIFSFGLSWLLRKAGGFKITTILFRSLYNFLYNRNIYKDIFEEHKPDLVFSTDILDNEDVRLLFEAKRAGVKTVGMVRSWDNLTNKMLLPVVPDRFVVHNQIIKQELIDIQKIDESKNSIFVTGIPQFDYYLNYSPTDKKYFFDKLGFDIDKKIMMFAPMGSRFISTDWQMLQVVHDAILNGEIDHSAQILVRLPPGDYMDKSRLKLSDKVKIYFDDPGIGFVIKKKKKKELTREDMTRLADSLYYSDVLINSGSSLCIDIAAFDKPIICPKFDGLGKVDFYKSTSHLFLYHHYRYLLRTDACKVVENKNELVDWINKYFKDPAIDRDKRARLVKEQCGRLDGRACERIVEVIK